MTAVEMPFVAIDSANAAVFKEMFPIAREVLSAVA
jgi:hypothetical protein